MSVTQVNIRMNSTLKKDGDMAFSQAGYTSTQAVRLLWEFAQRNIGRPERVRELFSQLEGAGKSVSQNDMREIAQRACKQRAKLYEDYDIHVPVRFTAENEDELAEALQEQLEQDRRERCEAHAERSEEREI